MPLEVKPEWFIDRVENGEKQKIFQIKGLRFKIYLFQS